MTITLKIEKKEVTEQQIDLPVPCFFVSKCGTKFIGLLDEKTVVEITSDEYENCIRNFNAERFPYAMERVKEAYQTFHSCAEGVFLEKHDEVQNAMSLHPILVP